MYLLDTHTMLWFLRNSKELSNSARATILSANKVFVSIASFWEIAIKQSLSKLEIDCEAEDLEKLCVEQDFEILPISVRDTAKVKSLPFYHKDPFDRILVAQAIENDLTLVTKDETIPKYDVKTLW